MANELLSKTITISIGGDAVARLTGWTIEVAKEAVDITNLENSGAWKEALVNLKEWSINFDGIVTRTGGSNYLSRLESVLNSDVAAEIIIADSEASTNNITGSGFITTSPLSGALGEMQTFSGTIQGTGVLTVAAP